MLIIWRGWGISVVAITAGCIAAVKWALNNYFKAGYYDAHKWPVGVSLVISAIVCLLLAMAVPNRGRHHLFFIPMLYWAPLLAVIGVVLFVGDPANPVATKSFTFPSLSAPAPAPAPSPVAASTAQTSNAATVAAAQKAAIQKYPALGNSGSSFNSAFVSLYKLYQKTNPGYFDDPAWPLNLADETAKFVK